MTALGSRRSPSSRNGNSLPDRDERVHRHAVATADSWVDKPNFARGIYYPVRMGFDRPAAAESRSVEMLIEEMDAAGIEIGVIMGRQSTDPLGAIPNDEIAQCVRDHPGRFLAWAGIDLAQSMDACLAELTRALALPNFRGVSIEPTIARTRDIERADDRRLYPIYEKGVKRQVWINISLSAVLQATVNRPYELSSPTQIYQLAKDFPELDIHVAHAAWPYVMEMIGVCFVCPNVWLSPDQYMIKQVPGAQEYVSREQLLSGSDTVRHLLPEQAAGGDGRVLDEWDWEPGVRERVLGANARRLMRIG